MPTPAAKKLLDEFCDKYSKDGKTVIIRIELASLVNLLERSRLRLCEISPLEMTELLETVEEQLK